jgi:hypothetical protein
MAETVINIPEEAQGGIELNETKILSFGEQLVGIEFNPSNDAGVAKVKQLCAEIANILKDSYKDSPGSPVKSLLFDHAVGELVSAQMAVVKVITFK